MELFGELQKLVELHLVGVIVKMIKFIDRVGPTLQAKRNMDKTFEGAVQWLYANYKTRIGIGIRSVYLYTVKALFTHLIMCSHVLKCVRFSGYKLISCMHAA